MLIDLVPNFLDAVAASDPVKAYDRYFDEHRSVLNAVWRNYVLDPNTPRAEELILRVIRAGRDDLHALLDRVDVVQIAEDTLARCEELFEIDSPVDLYFIIGVGGAPAGELVLHGRAVVFVCMEHFTGRSNPETFGLGLAPELLPVWIAHQVAHAVRYTSPTSRSELARIVGDAAGYYDYWETGSQATVGELLINEGLAVAASKEAAPGFRIHQYLGCGSRQYRRLRELEAFLRHVVDREFEERGLGFRLRYLGRGLAASSRRVGGKSIPEGSGYYIGYRMAEPHVAQCGIAASLRAAAAECQVADRLATGPRSQ